MQNELVGLFSHTGVRRWEQHQRSGSDDVSVDAGMRRATYYVRITICNGSRGTCKHDAMVSAHDCRATRSIVGRGTRDWMQQPHVCLCQVTSVTVRLPFVCMMTDRPASDADAETKHAQAGIAFSNSSVTLVLSESSLPPIPPNSPSRHPSRHLSLARLQRALGLLVLVASSFPAPLDTGARDEPADRRQLPCAARHVERDARARRHLLLVGPRHQALRDGPQALGVVTVDRWFGAPGVPCSTHGASDAVCTQGTGSRRPDCTGSCAWQSFLHHGSRLADPAPA